MSMEGKRGKKSVMLPWLTLCLTIALVLLLAAVTFPFFAHARGCGPSPSRFDVWVVSMKVKYCKGQPTVAAVKSGGCG